MLNNKISGGIIALLLAYYYSNRSCCTGKEGLTVETKSGKVKGIVSVSRDGREFYEWRGIPYAKPPQGALRFATPQPVDKWDGIRDGSAYGSACSQIDKFGGKFIGKEDCLYLNVYAPKINASKSLLPVMFWIHGGHFVWGSADQYKPDFFMDEDVIVVSVNYRLAALGFLNTGDSAVRGNMGLKDQSLALKWVNENILSFGGDPNQITIFGESAGSVSVHFQLLSPMSRGLMQRAISQSGSALNMWAMYEDPAGQAKTFAGKLNCTRESSLEMVECLRQVDLDDLLAIHRETLHHSRKRDTVFVPTVEAIVDEETFLAEHPLEALKSGKVARIPWLTGFNADEGLLFEHHILNNFEFRKSLENDPDFLAEVGLFLNETEKQFLDQIINFYFEDIEKLDLVEQFNSTVKVNTDRWFAYGIYKAATLHAKVAPVQFYYYNKHGHSLFDLLMSIKGQYPAIVEIFWGMTKNWFNSAVLGIPPVSYGVCHADDIAMLFELTRVFNVRQGDPHYEFSKDLVKTWASFAAAENTADVEFRGAKFPILDPNGEVVVLEINDIPEAKSLPTENRMLFWDSLYKQLNARQIQNQINSSHLATSRE